MCLITSLLLVQCYSYEQYVTKEYDYDLGDKLIRIVMSDGTKINFENSYRKFSMTNDSLLLVYDEKITEFSTTNTEMYHFVTHTINLKDVVLLNVMEHDSISTPFVVLGGTVLLLGLGYLVLFIISYSNTF